MAHLHLSLITIAFVLVTDVTRADAQMRTVPLPDNKSDTGAASVLLGENFRAYTDRILEQPLGRDNVIYSCDFVYDARTRKTCVRSLNVVEVGDPGDIRFWRMPGEYPNAPERSGRLANYALVGQIGASGYNAEGRATAYETVIQFFTRNNGTGYLCLSAATGVPSAPRNGGGRQAPADEAICHVMLLHDGSLVVSADTDPQQLPRYSLVVMGNLAIEGCLRVGDAVYGTCLPSSESEH